MPSLKGKIVFITGASSGIGKACAEQFAAQGAHVILTARRIERIQELADKLHKQHGVNTLAFQLDVRDKDAVKKIVDDLPPQWQEIAILINNAGLGVGLDKLQDGDPQGWDLMIDTNIKGLLYVTHAIIPGMLKRNTGHVVNLGSTAGHGVYPGGNVYCATKHAVKALNESLRVDLYGTPLRVTSIDPGFVKTEFSEVRFKDKVRGAKAYEGFKALDPEDIADAIIYCVTRPLHVDVAEMIIMPTAQAALTMIYKEKEEARD